MVCEKNNDKVHDFLKDPIELVRKGNAMMANGTTLERTTASPWRRI